MKIGVVGASGYSGGELLRLLENHPIFTASYIAAGTQAGSSITSVHPGLLSYSGRNFEATDISKINACDLVFFALPHGESAKLIAEVKDEVKIVDLGADFRLSSAASWEKYYGGKHAGTWTYGLAELPGNREKISKARHVANPGCYATSISLASAPAIAAKIINAQDIVVVAASGTTGAGKKLSSSLMASEVMNSLSSYKFGGVHQHTPEIEEALAALNGGEVKISFTPILAPMPRGILTTVTSTLTNTSLTTTDVHKLYREFFQNEKFVTVLPEGQMPSTSSVLGCNYTQLQVAVDQHTNRLIVSCVLDNLGKGAASQAIQNANLMCSLPEETGINSLGLGA